MVLPEALLTTLSHSNTKQMDKDLYKTSEQLQVKSCCNMQRPIAYTKIEICGTFFSKIPLHSTRQVWKNENYDRSLNAQLFSQLSSLEIPRNSYEKVNWRSK